MREFMKIRKRRIVIVLTALLICTLALYSQHKGIYREVQAQTLATLQDVALQNKKGAEKELANTQKLLSDITAVIQLRHPNMASDSDLRNILPELQRFASTYGFKRMGVILPNGITYTTDNYVYDLSGEEAYLYGMQGLPNITEALRDEIGVADWINVFSRPLYNPSNEVIGVIYAVYHTKSFKELLTVDAFNGEGYSYIINMEGNVVSDSLNAPMYGATNLLDSLISLDNRNANTVSELTAAMAAHSSSYATFEASETQYLYYTPLEVASLNTSWYMLTMVPAKVLDSRVAPILQHQNKFLLILMTVIVTSFVYFIWSYRKDARILHTLAYEDPLTKGDNYAYFLQKLPQVTPGGYMIALDLSEFKLINSICGFAKGDLILKATWDIIKNHLEKDELAAHLAADRYVMYFQAISKDVLLARLRMICGEITALAEQYNTVQTSPYFGIYQTTHSENAERCYTRALQAKRLAKEQTQKNWAFYEEVDVASITEKKQLEDHFDEAIANHEFEIWYQPKYDAENRTIVGAEALVRWRKTDGTLIPPYRFIPLFERNGMIVTLDEYVFTAVCRQIKEWEKQHKRHLPISINVSRASLYYEFILERYTEILTEYDVNPALVPLEVTESATSNNQQIQELVERFRQAGFPIYLDDFGNGYSSLATLNMMHFDTIKLDKSLVDYIGDTNGEKLLRYTIKLAKSLGMKITAEGVETENQVRFLQTLHCDEIQGYFFSKPLPQAEFEALI